MNREPRFFWKPMAGALVILIGLDGVFGAGPGRTEACALSPYHGGLTFPLENVDGRWVCRLQEVIDNPTIETTVGPLRAAMSDTMYLYLLDRPPFAAWLINRLGLGVYKSETKGPDRFWGDDGEGTSGIVQLVYQDPTSRIYFLEGSHDSRLLPTLTGKAVVLLRMNSVRDSGGGESMDSILVSYTKLDNRFLSGLASLLRPMIEAIVAGKLKKAVHTVNRLGLVMREHPERVVLAATNPPTFAADDVGFLKGALTSRQDSEKPGRRNVSLP